MKERRSFGIGGAGNIRTREEATIPGRQTAWEIVQERRKSSGAATTKTTSSSAETSDNADAAGGKPKKSLVSRLSAALGRLFCRSRSPARPSSDSSSDDYV